MIPFFQDIAREIATPAFQQTATLYGILALFISQVGSWIREYLKHKDFRNRNDEIRDLKKKVTEIGTSALRTSDESAEQIALMKDGITRLSVTVDSFIKNTESTRTVCTKRIETLESQVFQIVRNGHK